MSAAHRFDNALRYRDGAHPNQTQLTPAYILDPVRKALGGTIDLDPCTEPDNPTGAALIYTADLNGLQQPWRGDSIFVNPPYGKAREPWVDRCIEMAERDHLPRIVLLMPAHTDTRCWQKAFNSSDGAVLIRGRIKFGVLRPNRRQQAASHPSCLIGWNCSLAPCAPLGVWIKPRPT